MVTRRLSGVQGPRSQAVDAATRPAYTSSYIFVVHSVSRGHELPELESTYGRARDLVPLSTTYRSERARCLRQLRRWQEAEEEVDWLLARFPGYAKVRVEAARLYLARGRTDDAVAELTTALRIWAEADPDYRPAREARELLDRLRR